MGSLLADIDISRSVPLASFLELEVAVRAGMFRRTEIMFIITYMIVDRIFTSNLLQLQYLFPHGDGEF